MPRITRHTLGKKVDLMFTDLLELTLAAQYTKRENKRAFLETLSKKLDALKYFATLIWEAKGLEAKQYSQLSQKLSTIGRMLGKWIQSVS